MCDKFLEKHLSAWGAFKNKNPQRKYVHGKFKIQSTKFSNFQNVHSQHLKMCVGQQAPTGICREENFQPTSQIATSVHVVCLKGPTMKVLRGT